MKTQITHWENTFENPIWEKWLVSIIYKEFSKLNFKKSKSENRQMKAEYRERHFHGIEYTHGKQAYEDLHR